MSDADYMDSMALANDRQTLRELISDISEEYDLLDGTCKLSMCHHKQCIWRRDIQARVL
jgi:hypothetical protein